MTLKGLAAEDLDVIGRCLMAAAEGPYFPETEFHTLLGVERSEVRAVAAAWPQVDAQDEVVDLAVNNALVNLLGYPHNMHEQLESQVGVSTSDIERLLQKWRSRTAG